jgi:hypothetical protein
MRWLLLFVLATAGCKSEREKQDEAWHREFDALTQRYEQLPPVGAPELPPESVKGRKVLFAPRTFDPDGPTVAEAKSGSEAGIVVVWSVKRDAVPSRVYEGGIKGYGGQVQLTGWANPEGKRVAAKSYHCLPTTMIMRNVTSGATLDYDEHCSPSGRELREFAAALAAGRAPEGSNASDETRQAFGAIGAPYGKRLDERVGAPVDVHGKKLLLFAVEDRDPKLALNHNEYLLPASAYADTPGEVGVVVVERARHEAKPSVHYSNGADGYDGQADVIIFAHPSGRLLSRTPVRCHLASDDLVVNVLKQTRPERCGPDGDGVRAAIEALVGPLPKTATAH